MCFKEYKALDKSVLKRPDAAAVALNLLSAQRGAGLMLTPSPIPALKCSGWKNPSAVPCRHGAMSESGTFSSSRGYLSALVFSRREEADSSADLGVNGMP